MYLIVNISLPVQLRCFSLLSKCECVKLFSELKLNIIEWTIHYSAFVHLWISQIFSFHFLLWCLHVILVSWFKLYIIKLRLYCWAHFHWLVSLEYTKGLHNKAAFLFKIPTKFSGQRWGDLWYNA